MLTDPPVPSLGVLYYPLSVFLNSAHTFINSPFIFFFLRFYLFIHETQAEGEAGSLQGARCGTRSLTLGSRPEPNAVAQPLSHPGVPTLTILNEHKPQVFLQ